VLEQQLEALNTANICYCILHGYEEYPQHVHSDVDCLFPAEMLPQRLAAALGTNGNAPRTAVVQWLQHESTAHYMVLARRGGDGLWSFLAFDASSDYRRDGRVFYRGEEILESRRRNGTFWIPSPAMEFGYYLVKKLAKGSISTVHGGRLSDLFQRDPEGCQRELARFLGPESSRLVVAAASTGCWEGVQSRCHLLRAEMLRRTAVARPFETGRYWVENLRRCLRRWFRPTGLHVVVLGADGSGKSTVIEAVRRELAPAFRRTESRHFSPTLLPDDSDGSVTEPHGLPPRSLPASIAKLGYWFLNYTVGYHLTVRLALVRSTLVMFDRYLVDAFVDPKRYRYGAPIWLLRVVWQIVPKPDLVILLDAPAEVLQARKQEVAPEESARQRGAYRTLVERMQNGRIVDAARPIDRVVSDVNGAIVEFLAARTACRLGLEHRP
jgi:thymidylate kinase